MDADRFTVAGFRGLLQRDRESAWNSLHALAHASADRMARTLRISPNDADEISEIVLLRVVVDDFACLGRCRADADLEAWVHGVARNVAREWGRRRRGEPRSLRDLDPPDDATESTPAPRRRRHVLEAALGTLTETQRAVVRAILSGVSEREAARSLGVTRDRIHDVKRRAIARMRRAAPDRTVPVDRGWAAAASRRLRSNREWMTSQVLELYAVNTTRREIARVTGLSEKAVKERIRRSRSRFEGDGE